MDSGAVPTSKGSVDVLVNLESKGMCVLSSELQSSPAGEEG